MKIKNILLITTLFFSFSTAQALADGADDIVGFYWKGEQESVIEIYKTTADTYNGEVVWRFEPLQDVNNPDPALRDRDVVGLTFMEGFIYNAKSDQWSGGEVYAPDSGKTYQGNMWLENNDQTLKMRGYVGIPLFGRTASFKRLAADEDIPQ